MEIFGVGGTELLFIFIIMLIVAGPKRMVRWSYVLGQYVAKGRQMWAEVMSQMQKEFDDVGLDVQLPKEPPTRANLNRTITETANRALAPVTKPVQAALDETKTELQEVKEAATVAPPKKPYLDTAGLAAAALNKNGKPTTDVPKPPATSETGGVDLGSWSG